MSYNIITCEGEDQKVPDSFPRLLEHLGSSLVDLFFIPEKEGLSWVEFAKGYVKCCGRMSTSMSFNTLLRVYYVTAKNAGFTPKLEFESDEADCKINGSISSNELLMFLLMCWTMSWDGKTAETKGCLFLPDISHLILSAVVYCSESGSSFDVWDSDVYGLELELPIGKFLTWALTTVPSLTECLSQFCNSRLQNVTSGEVFSFTCCVALSRKKLFLYRDVKFWD